jgi:hypothetical protein
MSLYLSLEKLYFSLDCSLISLKKKHVGYSSVMHFEGHLVYIPEVNRPDLGPDEPPFGALQFTIAEMRNVLLDSDVNKRQRAGLNNILLFFRLFNRFFSKIVFLTGESSHAQ